MDVGGGEEVLAAGDVGDFLKFIVYDDGEVVGDADVFAGEDDVAIFSFIDFDFAVDEVVEVEGAVEVGGFGGV